MQMHRRTEITIIRQSLRPMECIGFSIIRHVYRDDCVMEVSDVTPPRNFNRRCRRSNRQWLTLARILKCASLGLQEGMVAEKLTDEQLDAILAEAGRWVINGQCD